MREGVAAPTLAFNANNKTVVQKLLDDPSDAGGDTIRALRIVGLLLARTRVPVTGANDLVESIACPHRHRLRAAPLSEPRAQRFRQRGGIGPLRHFRGLALIRSR